MGIRALAAASLVGVLGLMSLATEVPKRSCCTQGGKTQQGEAAKQGKLRCELTGQEVESCCCVEREGKIHCTLADVDVEVCCCRPVPETGTRK